MIESPMFFLILLFLFCLFVRLYPIRNSRTDFDSYGHLYYAYEVNRQKSSPWGSIKLKCWNSLDFSHPFLWHLIVGKVFGTTKIDRLRWVNGIIDSVYAFSIFFMLKYLSFDFQISLMGTLLYLFTPMWFSAISMGTRVASFTPRLVCEVIIPVIVFLALYILPSSNLLIGFVSVLLTIFVVMSSKFGIQVLLFTFPLISLFTNSLELIFILLAGLLLPILISKGEVFNMLRRQITHLVDYYYGSKDGRIPISDRNKFSKILAQNQQGNIDFKKTIWNLVAVNSFTSVFVKMPILLFSLGVSAYLIVFKGSEILTTDFVPFFVVLSIFILINQPRLLFLGEAERYLNHFSFFIILITLTLAEQTELIWMIWAFIFYGFLFWLIESMMFNKFEDQAQRKKADNLIEDYLKKLDEKRLVISYPYHNFSIFRIMLTTPHEVVFPAYVSDNLRSEFTQEFEVKYPFFDIKKVEKLSQVTSLNVLIIDNKTLIDRGYKDWQPPNSWKKVQLDQEVYDIYLLN